MVITVIEHPQRAVAWSVFSMYNIMFNLQKNFVRFCHPHFLDKGHGAEKLNMGALVTELIDHTAETSNPERAISRVCALGHHVLPSVLLILA